MDKNLSQKLSIPTYRDFGTDQALRPLFADHESASVAKWNTKRVALANRWSEIIGRPSFDDYTKTESVIDQFTKPDFEGVLVRQSTGPDQQQTLLLMQPTTGSDVKRPGVVVPFYHPDASAGYDLSTCKPLNQNATIAFGLHLVRLGCTVVCTEAFPYNTVPEPEDNRGFAWWQAAADHLLHEHPHWTGIGKLIHDTKRATDYLLWQNGVNHEAVAIVGHSLGGKMAFCTAAFDPRIKAVIASDFGIGWSFTNWDADWYFGPKIHEPSFDAALHELLALIAPRSFLLIAGQYDKKESWQYLQKASILYDLYRKKDSLGCIDHASGHRPPSSAVRTAYTWLFEQFEYAPDESIDIFRPL